MAHKYFLTELNENTNTAVVSGAEAKHLIRVMRIAEGDTVILTDKTGYDYTATAQIVGDDSVTFTVTDKIKNPAEPRHSLTVFMALPKSDKLEFITQKMCELGAVRLVPFVSEYCVAQKSKRDEGKVSRLQKISDEATKQCGRSAPMKVEMTKTFKEILPMLDKFDKTILLYEHGCEKLSDIDLSRCENVALIVGSEGGFSEKEREQMVAHGAVNIVLGARILRCETARVTGASLLMYKMGELE